MNRRLVGYVKDGVYPHDVLLFVPSICLKEFHADVWPYRKREMAYRGA